jgi:deazaflavin-dependent oxidoreductase (nitroreductase family)
MIGRARGHKLTPSRTTLLRGQKDVPTPRTKRLLPFTRMFNPLMRPFAARIPGFAIITYEGRRTGRTHSTPINVFHRDGDYFFALTYGPDAQWVKNVRASGTARLEERGRTTILRDPRLFTDPKASLVPQPIRLFLRLMRVTEFVRMSPGLIDRRGPPPGAWA